MLSAAQKHAAAPADGQVPAAGGGAAGQQPVEDAHHLHHARVLAQVVLGLGQERVLVAVGAQELNLRGQPARLSVPWISCFAAPAR